MTSKRRFPANLFGGNDELQAREESTLEYDLVRLRYKVSAIAAIVGGFVIVLTPIVLAWLKLFGVV